MSIVSFFVNIDATNLLNNYIDLLKPASKKNGNFMLVRVKTEEYCERPGERPALTIPATNPYKSQAGDLWGF